METVIGFAVGYWVGTRQGREGLHRAIDSAREIWDSPEARRLAGEGLTAAQSAAAPLTEIVRKAVTDKRRAMVRDVLDEFVERRFGRQPVAAAA